MTLIPQDIVAEQRKPLYISATATDGGCTQLELVFMASPKPPSRKPKRGAFPFVSGRM
jgi:hypothetical protein